MNRITRIAVLLAAASIPFVSHAHKTWLLPSATVLTPDQWITVDAAVSNDLFYFNHVPLRLDALTIMAPDGARIDAQNPSTGKYRSTFDVHLAQSGTYKLALLNRGVFASYEQNGAQKRWRGMPERLAAEIPADAKNLEVIESVGRIETYVTAGAPTQTVLKTTNIGLELAPVTHPNDLYAGEPATFRLLLDGKAASDLEVTVVPGGTRYRDQQNEMKLKTNEQGEISVAWPDPGMYWLEATLQDEKTSLSQAKRRRVSYVATFEVLPQ
jgi:uncharacterized GH25 family protein